ncbi:MAG: hypothetical protein OXR66_09470 [Candidatus Woesearchaeota archaeon]|nr:hypothetical protein [Candidatus Woesearchaeota archaeon]
MTITSISSSFHQFLDGKCNDARVASSVATTAAALVRELACHGAGLLGSIRYFSSTDAEMYEVHDDFKREAEDGPLLITHQPQDSNKNMGYREFSLPAAEYSQLLVLPGAITFLEIEHICIPSKELFGGRIAINEVDRVTSTEHVPLGPHSYMTVSTTQRESLIHYER